MRKVVFVAPFFLPVTVRFVEAAASVTGIRFALVSTDPVAMLSPSLRGKIKVHVRCNNCFEADELKKSVVEAAKQLGGCDRLFGALEHIQEQLAEVREAIGVTGLSREVARNFRDKSRMKEVLRAADVPCARYRLCESNEDLTGFIDEVGYPVVVKPPDGAGSKNTFRINSAEQLREILPMIRPTKQRASMAEEFITGQEHSFDVVNIEGKAVWHSITRYLPTPLEAMENPWIQWCVILPREVKHERFDEIRRVGTAALTALGMGTGITHMEWFRRADGSVAINEVAARPPGAGITQLMTWAHDTSFYRLWAELMIHGTFTPPQRPYAAGAAFLRGQGQGRVVKIHGLEQIKKDLGPMICESRYPKVGQSKSSGYEGEGHIVVRHPVTAAVEKALAHIVTNIRVELG